MKKTCRWELDVEEIMKDLELQSKSLLCDFDVLRAVTKAASMQLEKEKLMSKQQQQPRYSGTEHCCYYYSVIKIREPDMSAQNDDCIIDSLKADRESGGRFDDHDMRKASSGTYGSIARQCLPVDHHRSIILPGIKIADQEKVPINKTVKSAYPEGMPREEILKRERLLKKPMRYQDFVQEEVSKKNNHKNLKNGHKRRVIFEDSDTEEKDEEDRIRRKKRPAIMKEKLSPSNTSSKKVAKPGVIWENLPPPDMPTELRSQIEEMGGTEVKLVIQKVLQPTDCSRSHGRLSIPLNAVIDKDFLKDSEKEYLKVKTKNGLNFLPVLLVEPNLETIKIKFRQWNMKKKQDGAVSKEYVLNKPWNDVVQRNGLKQHDWIQLWSFRVDGNLCIALVVPPNMPNEASTLTRLED